MNSADITPRSVSGGKPDQSSQATDPSKSDSDQPDDESESIWRRGPFGRSWWIWGAGLGVITAIVLAAIFVPLPYVLLGPGSVRSAEDRVEVSGAESYDDDTDVMFTTIHVDDATLFGLIRGNLDDAIEINSREEIYPSGREASQKFNQYAMDFSKLIATREALIALGYSAEFTGEGAIVVDVVEDSPSDELLEPGDVIVEIDGQPVGLPTDLTEALEEKSAGESVELTVERPAAASGDAAAGESAATGSSETVMVEIELGSTDDGRTILGVQIEPASPSVESEVEVEVDSGRVTGPSAGLAWSLAIIDRLTEKSLTGDRDVAVTGEILDGGEIGQIGGVAQKVATVKRRGVDVLLYPASTPSEDQEEMERIADGDVELVPVATLDEALKYLDPDGVILATSAA